MVNELHNRYDPVKDLPSLEGKVIFITGVWTTGIGEASVRALAKHNPAYIYFTGRNTEKAHNVISDIESTGSSTKFTFLECDFQSSRSVKSAMKGFTHPKLDVLILNAGIMAKPPGLSKDGWEVQFAVNHIAHALIVRELLPILNETASKPLSDVRIVVVSSLGAGFAQKSGINFATLDTVQDGFMGPWARYGQSKLANILHAHELARRYPNITSVSLQPGVTQTDLVASTRLRDRLLIAVTNLWQPYFTVEEGSLNQIWLAVGAKKESLVNGAFYLPVGVESKEMLENINNRDQLATELWDWTENVLKDV